MFPKNTKYRKQFKGKFKRITNRGCKITQGDFALKSLEQKRLTAKQIESARRVIIRKMGRLGFLWIRIFPDTPVTAKPTETRMGKGKGSIKYWASKTQSGQILYEISGISEIIAKKALSAGANKLPVLTKIVKRNL